MCILYDEAKTPMQLLTNITACTCHTLCYGDEACGWRKFCPASQRRLECKAAALEAYNTATPCARWVKLKAARR